MLSDPVAFDLHLEATLNHRVPSELCQRALGHLVYLDEHLSSVNNARASATYMSGNTVLLEQRFLCAPMSATGTI